MGRAGEVILRTWQTAHKMKVRRGPLPGDGRRTTTCVPGATWPEHTINPALAHGIAHEVGWSRASWRTWCWEAGPLRRQTGDGDHGGFIAWSVMGDANASRSPTPQPVLYRPMFGAIRQGVVAATSLTFTSQAAYDGDIAVPGLANRWLPCGCRSVGKADMVLNDAMPAMRSIPKVTKLRADGDDELLTKPAAVLPMAQRYFLF